MFCAMNQHVQIENYLEKTNDKTHLQFFYLQIECTLRQVYPEERSSYKDERRSKVPWTATWTGVKQTLLPDVGSLIDKRVKRGLVGRCYLAFFRVVFLLLFLFSDKMPDFVRFYLRLIWMGNKVANIKKRE